MDKMRRDIKGQGRIPLPSINSIGEKKKHMYTEKKIK